MARKIESWTKLVIGEAQNLAEVLLGRSEREIVIITCSMIDSLLADLIATALRDNEKEIETFLGLNSDGRAPLGSFGSRIQAAYLLHLIEDGNLKILRILKGIRNRFAHRVVVSFGETEVASQIRTLTEFVRDHGPREIKPGREYTTKEEFSKKLAELSYSRDECVGFYVGAAASQIKHLHEICNKRKKRGSTAPEKKKNRKK